MDVVAIHIDSTDINFHSFPANRIPVSLVSRMVESAENLFWKPLINTNDT